MYILREYRDKLCSQGLHLEVGSAFGVAMCKIQARKNCMELSSQKLFNQQTDCYHSWFLIMH